MRRGGAAAAAVCDFGRSKDWLVFFVCFARIDPRLLLTLTMDTMICRSSFAVAGATSRKKLHSSFLSRKNACRDERGSSFVRVRHGVTLAGMGRGGGGGGCKLAPRAPGWRKWEVAFGRVKTPRTFVRC